jgi:hypothetical protein
MDVIGHDRITDHDKLVTLAHFFEDLEEEIAPHRACQPRLGVITTTGEKVEIVVTGISLEAVGHSLTVRSGRHSREGNKKTKPR